MGNKNRRKARESINKEDCGLGISRLVGEKG